MIIAIDASRANKDKKTGVEWYSYHLVQELKKIIPSEIEVRLYSSDKLKGELSDLPENWKSCVLSWPLKYFWTMIRLSYEMFHRPPDLLFVPSHTIPLVLPSRTVTTIHDLGYERFPELYSFVQRNYLRWANKRALKRCSRVITISEWTKKEIIEVYKTTDELIKVVPLGYDKKIYHSDVSMAEIQKAEEYYGLIEPYFIYVGRLETKKNIANILKAFSEFKKTDENNYSFILVGQKGYGSRNFELLVEQGKVRGVKHIQFVSEENKVRLMAGAKALVFPTRYEGFGLPIIESMALGVPVITSNYGATKETSGDASLLVELDDISEISEAMRRVATDGTLRARLISTGLEHARSYSWEKTARETWEILKK